MIVICPNCGNKIDFDNPVFCNKCGFKLPVTDMKSVEAPARMFCTGCGAELNANAEFCTKCGQPRVALPRQNTNAVNNYESGADSNYSAQSNNNQEQYRMTNDSVAIKSEVVFKVIYISLMVISLIISYTGGCFVNVWCSSGVMRVNSDILDYKYSYLGILLKSNKIILLVLFIILSLGLTTWCIISALNRKYKLAGVLSILSMVYPLILSFVGTLSKKGWKQYSGYVGLGAFNIIYFILMFVSIIIIFYNSKHCFS